MKALLNVVQELCAIMPLIMLITAAYCEGVPLMR